MLVLLLLWIVYLVAVPICRLEQGRQGRLRARAATGPATRPARRTCWSAATRASDLTKEERKELGTGNAGGQRTDTIMLLHTGSGPNLLMSIPRDSIVDVPGHGTTKINAAYAFGGPELLVQTIEDETGIRVDHYVEIGFGGFVDMVDAVGGIEICPKRAMNDPQANLNIKKGCQEVDGKTALGYARSRHTSAARRPRPGPAPARGRRRPSVARSPRRGRSSTRSATGG